MLEKIVKLAQLYDWYGPLLTEKQCEMFELYYHQNLSLAEIANEHAVSRTAVHDILLRTESQLFRYEDALGLSERFGEFLGYVEEAERLTQLLQEDYQGTKPERIVDLKKIVRGMHDVWNRDHSKEGE